MPIRYAILKAVSSEAQAGPDKVSLEVQETRSREQARQRGWVETAGPYTIPGESRTRYVNLSHAEAAMPDLKRMRRRRPCSRLRCPGALRLRPPARPARHGLENAFALQGADVRRQHAD